MDFKTSAAGKNSFKRIERAIEKLASNQLGAYGSKYIADTDDHTAPAGEYFTAIFATAASALDASSMPNSSMEDIGDLAIPAGETIYGKFPVISLGSGSVIAYKSSSWADTTDSGD
tara:strand:+ start:129 stop:476 length:348 start_codon:yes stop_codon:yes gene_type:complete